MNIVDGVDKEKVQDLYPFSDPKQQMLFNKITHELRCSVCQNQSLAESNAILAIDLKKEIFSQVKAQASEQQIIDFMASRYGQFVLYEPPVKGGALFLWFGPLCMALIGIGVLIKMISFNRNYEKKS